MLAHATLSAFIATSKPDEALAFYRDVLGLELVEDSPFALLFLAGDTPLRVQKVPAAAPPPYTSLGWRVPDIEAAVRALVAAGVPMQRYPGMPQDELGIWSAPGNARIAWFHDPDGHTLSLSQQD